MPFAEPTPALDFTPREEAPNLLIVSLRGLLRHAQDLTGFHALVRRAVARSGVHVVLDMAEVSFVNSFGLGFLMLLRGEIDRAQGTLALCRPNEALARTLTHTKINSLIPVFESPDEAKAHALSAG